MFDKCVREEIVAITFEARFPHPWNRVKPWIVYKYFALSILLRYCLLGIEIYVYY